MDYSLNFGSSGGESFVFDTHGGKPERFVGLAANLQRRKYIGWSKYWRFSQLVGFDFKKHVDENKDPGFYFFPYFEIGICLMVIYPPRLSDKGDESMIFVLAGALVFSTTLFAEDVEMVQGFFKSENNQIEEIHLAGQSGRDFVVFKLRNKLTGKNSRARILSDKRANFGDSASSFGYMDIQKGGRERLDLAQSALVAHSNVDLIYNCGEQPDDKKRKVFPFYVETNCEIEAITVRKPKEKRVPW